MSDLDTLNNYGSTLAQPMLPRARVRTRAAPSADPAATATPCATLADRPDYEVGYRKPPMQGQFKPGQSGNPHGRKRQSKGLNMIVRETLGGKVTVRTARGTKQISKIEAVLQKTLEKAMKGGARALVELMKLWRAAVPDVYEDHVNAAPRPEKLTAADLAIIDAFRGTLLGQGVQT